jgi:probable F420-dependent oxidoreductase
MSVQALRFGVSAGTASSRTEWQDLARRAEAIGFDILQVADHLDDCLPPLTLLCSATDVTERLRLGTLVVNNDLRHPVLLAREAATVALFSDGRFELGLGAGNAKREYDQAGLRFDGASTRIARLGESVEIVRRLLEGEELTFHGAHYQVTDHRIHPVPAQRPPILIGGNGDRLLTVAARQADIVGFTGFSIAPDGEGGKPTHSTAAAMEERIAFVRKQAGPRFDALELQVLVQYVIATADRRGAARELSARLHGSLTTDDILDSPFMLIGTPDQMADTLRERSQRFGINHWTVFASRPGSDQTLETLAPVIERLR